MLKENCVSAECSWNFVLVVIPKEHSMKLFTQGLFIPRILGSRGSRNQFLRTPRHRDNCTMLAGHKELSDVNVVWSMDLFLDFFFPS